MSSQEKFDRIPDWRLERFLLGELDPGEMEIIRQEIEKDHSLKHRLQALRQSDREILERYPASMMDRRIREKLKKPGVPGAGFRTLIRSKLWPVPAIPALAVLILLAILPSLFPPAIDETRDAGGDRAIRLKGTGAQLHLYRKTDSGSEGLENGSLARENDLILVQYQAAGRAYGVILSIDGRGTVSRHFPREGEKAGKLERQGPVSLDFAYELDDAPRWEIFYFITSDSPFEVDSVMRAVRGKAVEMTDSESGMLDLPDRFEQYLFTLRKEENDDS